MKIIILIILYLIANRKGIAVSMLGFIFVAFEVAVMDTLNELLKEK